MQQRNRARGSRAAAAAVALAFIVAPAGASAHQPADDCAQAETLAIALPRGLTASLDAAPALAAVLADPRPVIEVENVVIARRAELELLRGRLDQAARAQVEIDKLARIDGLATLEKVHSFTAWDRDVERGRAAISDVLWHFETLDQRDQPGGALAMVADAIVAAARFPARAGIVAKNLIGAAAKITPRVARALF